MIIAFSILLVLLITTPMIVFHHAAKKHAIWQAEEDEATEIMYRLRGLDEEENPLPAPRLTKRRSGVTLIC